MAAVFGQEYLQIAATDSKKIHGQGTNGQPWHA
jgi:hypothetical protein